MRSGQPNQITAHIRPALHLIARLMAKFHDLFVSFYVARHLISQAENYVTTYHPGVCLRVRITSSFDSTPKNILKVHERAIEVNGSSRPDEVNSCEQMELHEDSRSDTEDTEARVLEQAAGMPFLEGILCLEREFGPWIAEQLLKGNMEINGMMVEAPSHIIEDFVNSGVALANEKYHKLPISYFWTSSVASFTSNKCGTGSRLHNVLVSMSSQEPKKYLQEVLAEVVLTPGLPRHYEYEQVAQDTGDLLPGHILSHKRWDCLRKHTDRVVFASLYEMESIAVEACASAFPKKLASFCTGLAADLPSPTAGQLDLDASNPVIGFMNHAYTELGLHSVIYIGFGSSAFPPAESAPYLKVLIEEILAYGFRIVVSASLHHRRKALLNEEYTEELERGGYALFAEWVEQLEVLEHPALHYFLSHGGWNSITEAIVRGVPMIIWPISADQPINATYMSKKHDCCFELLQVRTGTAKSVAYSDQGDIQIVGSTEAVRKEIRTVLALSKSERGVQQRQTMKALRNVAMNAIEAGGSGDLALERFGKTIGL
ncbi:unnamed protein product [Rhizoctonia solani]|uniref:UDP-glycosyltransferases domain-containing protein n=1 Tax=Rhizoctonia solani TaxID=456999 RepID=A0A8H3HVE4_9AGAM|nr:unnamed protein product [Rhizoctonia solani]